MRTVVYGEPVERFASNGSFIVERGEALCCGSYMELADLTAAYTWRCQQYTLIMYVMRCKSRPSAHPPVSRSVGSYRPSLALDHKTLFSKSRSLTHTIL